MNFYSITESHRRCKARQRKFILGAKWQLHNFPEVVNLDYVEKQTSPRRSVTNSTFTFFRFSSIFLTQIVLTVHFQHCSPGRVSLFLQFSVSVIRGYTRKSRLWTLWDKIHSIYLESFETELNFQAPDLHKAAFPML